MPHQLVTRAGNVVTVSLIGDPEDRTKEPFIRVKVSSAWRPNSSMQADIPVTSDKIEERVMAAGGACAELLLERKLDLAVDPDQCASAALKAFQEVKRRLAKDIGF